MPKRKRRNDVTKDLKRLAKYFAEEMASRAWGKNEFDKLIKASKAAGENSSDKEREATRHVLAVVDRTMSVREAARCAAVILRERPGARVIPAKVFWDVLQVVQEQVARATADAFLAGRALQKPAGKFEARLRRLTLPKAAAALAQLPLDACDLGAYRAAAKSFRARKGGALSRALDDSLAAATFLGNAIEVVDHLVANAARKARALERAPLIDLMTFVTNCASFVQDVVTVRINEAVGGDSKPDG